jgi:hypothetical protein
LYTSRTTQPTSLVASSMRNCNKCERWLLISEFYPTKRSRSGIDTWCKDCHFEKKLRRHYNLTPVEYDAMLLSQDGKCAICRQKPEGKRLSVDHDHACCPGDIACGKCVRGLLCDKCNWWLGQIEDDLGMLVAAENYLRSYNALQDL